MEQKIPAIPLEGVENYPHCHLETGILKILSKMGISLLPVPRAPNL